MTTSRITSGLLRSATNGSARKPFAVSSLAPAATRSAFRPIKASEKPLEPNCSATAVEMPGPKPPIMIVFLLPLVRHESIFSSFHFAPSILLDGFCHLGQDIHYGQRCQ